MLDMKEPLIPQVGVVTDIRIDTHADNVIMRHLLCKNGFSEVGTILLSNGSPRVAYQWVR